MRDPNAPCLLCPCCKHHVDDLTQTLAGDWLCGPCAEETDAELRELEDRDAADALSAFVRADTLPPAERNDPAAASPPPGITASEETALSIPAPSAVHPL